MQEITAITLAMMVTISTWYNDGLKALQNKKYDQAIAQLTKVYEKAVPGNVLREQALFFRAQAHMGKKDKKKACGDLLTLLKTAKDQQLRKQSLALYKKWGGDPKKLLPKDSPKVVFQKFIANAKKGNLATCMDMSSGQFKKLIMEQTDGDPDELKEEFDDEEFEITKEKIGGKKEAGKAWITVSVGDGDNTVVIGLILDQKNMRWTLDRIFEKGDDDEMVEIDGKGSSPRARIVNDAGNLKQIGLACLMYSGENSGKFPPNFKALDDETILNEGPVYYYIDPTKGRTKLTYIYCPGLKDDDANPTEKMLAADPKPYKGKRNVLFVDGHVAQVDEKTFQAQAKKQKWKVKGAFKKEDVPKETQAKIKELVKELGDESFKVRRAAKKKLIALGWEIHPVLEDYLKHKDPEVKSAIQEILNSK